VTFQAEHTVAGLDCRHHLPAIVALQMPQSGVDGPLQSNVVIDIAEFLITLNGNEVSQNIPLILFRPLLIK